MAFCKNCGTQIDDNAVVCPKCGVAQGNPPPPPPPVPSPDTGGFGWTLLGCCIPIVGLILFLVWKDTKPVTSKAAGMGALVGVIVGVVSYILLIVLGVAASFI